MQRRIIYDRILLNRPLLHSSFNQTLFFSSDRSLTLIGPHADDPFYADIPSPRRDKSERKPYPTPMKVLIRRAKQEREARKFQPCRILEHPPDNGLLVPELIQDAHRVYRARQSLLFGLTKLLQVVPVQRCRFCFEVHIGHMGHEIRTCTGSGSGKRSATHVWRKGGVSDVVYFPKCFHLHDRVGKPRVGHDERLSVPRIPAVVELCIQAGVNLDKFPARRRTKPVYSIEGRIVDFEQVADNMSENFLSQNIDEVITNFKLEKITDALSDGLTQLRDLSIETMDSWFEMISGAKKIMEKYSVLTCGYCLEVQVGPKGHKVRMCKGTKHQARDGQHAWQEATIEDLVGPNYVWHVRDLNGPPLDDKLKRFYGKAPALVQLCVHAGAPVPDEYRSMMRLDVVPPNRDEVDLVA